MIWDYFIFGQFWSECKIFRQPGLIMLLCMFQAGKECIKVPLCILKPAWNAENNILNPGCWNICFSRGYHGFSNPPIALPRKAPNHVILLQNVFSYCAASHVYTWSLQYLTEPRPEELHARGGHSYTYHGKSKTKTKSKSCVWFQYPAKWSDDTVLPTNW